MGAFGLDSVCRQPIEHQSTPESNASRPNDAATGWEMTEPQPNGQCDSSLRRTTLRPLVVESDFLVTYGTPIGRLTTDRTDYNILRSESLPIGVSKKSDSTLRRRNIVRRRLLSVALWFIIA